MGTVLVVTDAEDYTSDLIVAALIDRDMTVVRLDPGAGPVHLDAEMDPRSPGARWRGLIGDEHRAARLEDVVSVLWRWPTPPAGHPGIEGDDERAWAAKEDTAAIHGVLKALSVRWVNHPDRITVANSKPGQLATAASCGFLIPETLMTTSGDITRAWVERRPDVLYKAFHAQGVEGMVTANRVRATDLPAQLGAASTFQRVIDGHSVRVTVIGPHVFAVAISGTSALDWRPHSDKLTYTPTRVPADILARLRNYQQRFGLEYGAYDFIVEATGQWVFLECNPSGMYGFVEIRAGMEITAAIADRLCEPVGFPVTRQHPVRR